MMLFVIGQIIFDFAAIIAICLLVVVAKELSNNMQELSKLLHIHPEK